MYQDGQNFEEDVWVNVSEILTRCVIYTFLFSTYSAFIYLPIKHYDLYKIDQFKSKYPYTTFLHPPNPCPTITYVAAIVWMVLMNTYTILLATSRLTPQVNLCSGEFLTSEEKKLEENIAMYDIQIGSTIKFIAIINIVFCSATALHLFVKSFTLSKAKRRVSVKIH